MLGDGDFLMGNTAIWTAAHYQIPCLMRRLQQPLVLQRRAAPGARRAIERGRPPENRWIGQRIGDPDIDLAAMGRAQGARGIGPVTDAAALPATLRDAIEAVRAGEVVVVDVRVAGGYSTGAASTGAEKAGK